VGTWPATGSASFWKPRRGKMAGVMVQSLRSTLAEKKREALVLVAAAGLLDGQTVDGAIS